MNLILRSLILIPAFAMASGCASTPDPAEVCSAEWITPRATKAVAKIEQRTGSSIRNLGKVSQSFAKGKTPGPIEMFTLSRSLNKMKKELTDGKGIRDLRTVAKTCNDPNLIKDSMRDLMKRKGVSESALNWMENNPFLESIISGILNPDLPAKSG